MDIGQRIELKMIRFSYFKEKKPQIPESQEEEPCRHYLIIKDGSNRREVGSAGVALVMNLDMSG